MHAECEYRQPLRFEDEVEVHLRVREKRQKAVTYDFIFRKLGGGPPVEVARGKLTVVCVTRNAHGKMSAHSIPAVLADQLEVAPSELLE